MFLKLNFTSSDCKDWICWIRLARALFSWMLTLFLVCDSLTDKDSVVCWVTVSVTVEDCSTTTSDFCSWTSWNSWTTTWGTSEAGVGSADGAWTGAGDGTGVGALTGSWTCKNAGGGIGVDPINWFD